MSAAFWSGETARRLAEAALAHKHRVRHLNRVAQGEEVLTGVQRVKLTHSERRIVSLLKEFDDVAVRLKQVSTEDIQAERERLPRPLREQYEILFCRAYGSDPAVSAGDPAVERGAGKRQTRTSSGQVDGQIPGAPTSTKKFGQGNRNMIKDRRAYELKLRIDRKLRRLAADIEEELAGSSVAREVNVCSRCARIGEQEWRYCPSCGFTMEMEER